MSAILIYRFGYRNTPEISVEVPQHKRMKIIRQDTICGVLPCQRRNAVHHLEVHLSDVLTAELRRVLCRQEPELDVRIARQTMQIPLSKVHYAASQNHIVRVVTDDGECRAAATFSQVEQELSAHENFLVCNRGVLLNMDKVLRFEGDCFEMLDGARLPIRQKDKNTLLARFTQYQFRHMQREF